MLPDWIELLRSLAARSVEFLLIGREPFRVDLLTSIPGVAFEEACARRTSVELDGMTVPLIGREDLIANKKAVGRLQDLADVEALEAIAES